MLTKGDLRKLTRMLRDDPEGVKQVTSTVLAFITEPKPRKTKRNVGGHVQRARGKRKRGRKVPVASDTSANG